MTEFDLPGFDRDARWRSDNPRFGIVRAVITDGEYSIVLDDLNSDHREVELRAYERGDRGWRELFEMSDVGFPDAGQSHGGGWEASSSQDVGYGWNFGRDRPGAVISLAYRGRPVHVTAGVDGWWLCFRETPGQRPVVPVRIG